MCREVDRARAEIPGVGIGRGVLKKRNRDAARAGAAVGARGAAGPGGDDDIDNTTRSRIKRNVRLWSRPRVVYKTLAVPVAVQTRFQTLSARALFAIAAAFAFSRDHYVSFAV